MSPLSDEILSQHLACLRLQGQSEGTIYARSRALARMGGRIPVPLLEATPAHLLAWRAGLTVTGNTVVQYASHARGFYIWAMDEGLITVNPARRLPLPRLVRGVPRPISEQDLMRAVRTAPRRIRPWLALAGWGGFRVKEIALLRRECVLDTAAPPALIVAADATKGSTERIVQACTFLISELRDAGLPRSGWMFGRADGLPGPNAPWLISHLLSEYLHDCGISATPHQLRHRYGTQLYHASGHDLRLVQEQMGHRRPETTARYVAYYQAEAAVAVEALPVPPPRLRAA